MFQELNSLLVSLTSLTLSLAGNQDGTLTVTVTPKGAKVSGALDTPLSLTGTAPELDEDFASILASYTTKRQNLSDQLAATEAILDAAKNEATDKAKKSIAKPVKSINPVVEDEGSEGFDDEGDDEYAVNTAPSSIVSISTPAVAASNASDLWA